MSTPRVISVTSRKGGAGKSTISMLLASALAISGNKKVLLIDSDNQNTVEDTRNLETAGMLRQTDTPPTPPYTIESVPPQYLQAHASKYDIILIDMPRITDDSQESAAVQSMSFCDSILVPVLSGRADSMSAQAFIEILKGIKGYKKKHDFSFKFMGFMNKETQHRKGVDEKLYMEKLGLPMMEHSLKDLKMFLTPSTYNSFLDDRQKSKRFKPFYDEFCKHFKL